MSKIVEISSLFNQPGLKIVALVITLGVIISSRHGMSSTSISAESLLNFENELAIVQANVNTLQTRIENSKSSFYLEKLQRNELLKSKEGEMVLQIADIDYQDDLQMSQSKQVQERTIYEEWRQILGI